jgi:serine/threonine protein kinase
VPFELKPGHAAGGRYVLERALGAGGMGEVWAARDSKGGARVAIKFIKRDVLGPDGRRRMLREARAARKVTDPSIVPVLDVIESEAGEPALVMELLEGGSLALEPRPMTSERAIALLFPVARALAAAHEKGVIHRDVKPENIFVTASGEVKVFDFGIAKEVRVDSDTAASLGTQTGAILGTPQYMSPEQAFGEKDVDHRTDVWSLGVVLFQCLTGKLPIQADSLGQILKQLLGGPLPKVRDVSPDVDPALASLVDRMLRQDREARPLMADVARVLEDLASGERAAKGAVIRVGESDSNDAWDPTQAPQGTASAASVDGDDSLLERIAGLPDRVTPSDDLDRSGHRLAHYQILEKLGRGGMGIVYVAEDVRLKRKVALKVLPTRVVRSEERRVRFLREARSASAVHHPNVATIFDVGESDGIVFIAMEWVKGRTLRHAMREAGVIEPRRAVEIALDVARGLACAHENAVVHRDIKPENVMISPDGTAKILDFGLAKSLHTSEGPNGDAGEEPDVLASRAGRVLGTPAYMSPEQAASEPVDARTDIYAMGVVIHEMLTGQRPAQSPKDALRKQSHSIQALVGRCLGPIEDRFRDGRALVAALADVAADRRSSTWLLPAVLGLGAVAAAAAVLTWSARRGSDEEPAWSSDLRESATLAPSGLASGPAVSSPSAVQSAPAAPSGEVAAQPSKPAPKATGSSKPPPKRAGPDPLSQQK